MPEEPDRRTAALADHLRANARHYVPGCAGVTPDVTLIWREVRSRSTVCGFDVDTGSKRHPILVKVLPLHPDPRPPTGDPTKDRPRLTYGLEFNPTLWCEREYQALTALYDQVREARDPRVDAVRVHEALPKHRAIVMDFVSRPNLRRVLRPSWLRVGGTRVVDPPRLFRNAGVWLKMYHGLPRPEPLASRHTRRHEFVAHVLAVTEFLVRTVGDPPFFEHVAETVERAAEALLPESLPVGLGHGDFAMRNILAASSGAVSVIDTNAAWRTSIYEDLGYFLTDLKCNASQVFSGGRRFGERTGLYEDAFLEGYFEGQAPLGAVRLYEVQACLDKWAAVAAERTRAERLAPRLFFGLRLGLTSSHFRNVIEGHLAELRG